MTDISVDWDTCSLIALTDAALQALDGGRTAEARKATQALRDHLRTWGTPRTADEHAFEAEYCLAIARNNEMPSGVTRADVIAVAQVHATLAMRSS